MGPVVNQGTCANCWAVSSASVFTGLTNRYLPDSVKAHYAAEAGAPDENLILSIDQLTQCTS